MTPGRIPLAVLTMLAEGTAGTEAMGWAAAVTTGALLGPVLYWLCYVHLPSKDRQIEKLIADSDKLMMDLLTKHDEERSAVTRERNNEHQVRVHTAEIAKQGLEDLMASFAAELKEERDTCERRHKETVARSDERHKEIMDRADARHKEMLEVFARNHDILRDAKHEIANIAQDRANARALQKLDKSEHHGGKKGGQP